MCRVLRGNDEARDPPQRELARCGASPAQLRQVGELHLPHSVVEPAVLCHERPDRCVLSAQHMCNDSNVEQVRRTVTSKHPTYEDADGYDVLLMHDGTREVIAESSNTVGS